MITVFSVGLLKAHHAKRVCDLLLEKSDPPPYHSIRFVLFPQNWIVPAAPAGIHPGWIVSYAHPSARWARGFFVSLSGEVAASGQPLTVPAVRVQAKRFAEFITAMNQLDIFLQPGMPYSNIVARLGPPVAVSTNGHRLDVHFNWEPPMFPHSGITNGFVLGVTNGIMVHKAASILTMH